MLVTVVRSRGLLELCCAVDLPSSVRRLLAVFSYTAGLLKGQFYWRRMHVIDVHEHTNQFHEMRYKATSQTPGKQKEQFAGLVSLGQA
jgi:hypothetical protein